MSFKYVKIYYGPCDTFNNVKHKPQKLSGLKDDLQKRGFVVDLMPVEYLNYCMLEMCGHEIFRCNIKNLCFNTHHSRDKACERAIQAVVDSSQKFNRARTYLWLWMMLEQQVFRRGPLFLVDYWPVPVEDNLETTCTDCSECCRVPEFRP